MLPKEERGEYADAAPTERFDLRTEGELVPVDTR